MRLCEILSFHVRLWSEYTYSLVTLTNDNDNFNMHSPLFDATSRVASAPGHLPSAAPQPAHARRQTVDPACSSLEGPFCNCGGNGPRANCSCASCGTCVHCPTCVRCSGAEPPSPPTSACGWHPPIILLWGFARISIVKLGPRFIPMKWLCIHTNGKMDENPTSVFSALLILLFFCEY